jgi:hypothetical protein
LRCFCAFQLLPVGLHVVRVELCFLVGPLIIS